MRHQLRHTSVWVGERLSEIEANPPCAAKEWGQLAMERAGFEICWATTDSKAKAKELEERTIAQHETLWNRNRGLRLKGSQRLY